MKKDSSVGNRQLKELLEAAKRKKEREQAALNKPCYILYPESKIVTARDMMSFVALLLTFVVVPFEVAFVDAPPIPDPTDALWIFNRIVDVIFALDVLVQFVTMTEHNAHSAQGSIWVTEPAKIAWGYFSSWFALDIFAVGIGAIDVYAVAASSSARPAWLATPSRNLNSGTRSSKNAPRDAGPTSLASADEPPSPGEASGPAHALSDGSSDGTRASSGTTARLARSATER